MRNTVYKVSNLKYLSHRCEKLFIEIDKKLT